MIEKLSFRYPFGVKQSACDVEEYTALELACKTAYKMNEVIDIANIIEQSAIEARNIVDEMVIDQTNLINENNEIIANINNKYQELLDSFNSEFTTFKNDLNASKSTFIADINTSLETFKVELQNEIETFKSNSNTSLESYKTTINNNLNEFKENSTNEFNTFKTNLTNELESFKASMQSLLINEIDKKLDEGLLTENITDTVKSLLRETIVDPKLYGADPTGATSINTILSSIKEQFPNGCVILINGNFLIDNAITLDKGYTLLFSNGKLILNALFTFYGKIIAPKTLIFEGNNYIVGLPTVLPEWFGGYPDLEETYPSMGTDCTNALKKCIYCIENTTSSKVRGYTIQLSKGVYCVTNTLTFSIKSDRHIKIIGEGQLTQIRAYGSNFTGEALLEISTSVDQTMQSYELRKFRLQNDNSTLQLGLKIGNDVTNCQIQSLHNNIIEDIAITDFKIGVKFYNSRLVNMRNCSVWNSNIDNSIGIYFKASKGGFSGDSTIQDLNLVQHTTSGRSVIIEATDLNSGCAGIRFKNCVSYKSDIAYSLNVENNGYINDVWLTDCQIDNVHNKTVQITTSNGKINNIHVRGLYATMPKKPIYINASNVGEVNYIFIDECYFNGAGEGVIYANKVNALNFTNCICPNPSVTEGGYIIELTNCMAIIISKNDFLEWSLGTVDGLIKADSTTDRLIITENIFNGASGVDETDFDLSNVVHKVFANNLNY